MGPRLPSVRWPAAHQNGRNTPPKQGKFESKKPDNQKPEVPKNQRPKVTKKAEAPSKVRLTPAETVSKAAAKVARLEAALAALEDSDDADVVQATVLKEAFKKARA